MSRILVKYIRDFAKGLSLGVDDAVDFLDSLISETDEAVLAAVFRNWDVKGIDEDEIFLLARIMRDRCGMIRSKHENFVDIVGTGGSHSKTFNVSTAAAFVTAGGGLPVAKHGNKAATSSSGSADVLSALGIDHAANGDTAELSLNEIGICFMFAPNFHRLSPTLAKVRRGLGFPTIFNCVGPLCNPAGAPHQVIGVWDQSLVGKMANALSRLGTKRSWIVHGENGLDEISISGRTYVAEIDENGVREFEIRPEKCSLSTMEVNGIKTATPDESASIIRSILAGDRRGSAAEALVLINAMAAFHVAGRADGFAEAVEIARESIETGRAAMKMSQLSQRMN